MSSLLLSTAIGMGAGIIGTGLGGAMAFFLNKPSKRFLSTLISFSAGLMIAVVCFDLLPESFEIGNLPCGLFGVIMGVAMIIVCEEIIEGYRRRRGGMMVSNHYAQTGILLGIGIALHNFPEGLAIGSGFTAMASYGWGLSLMIALHDIPEGIAMVTPMRIGGIGKFKAFMAAVLAGIPTGIGAMIGFLLGEVSPELLSMCLGFAGGAMLYITCSELIPESKELYKGRFSGIGLIIGVITGIVLSSMI